MRKVTWLGNVGKMLRNFLSPISPITLEIPIWRQYNEAVGSGYVYKVGRNGSVSRQHAVLAYPIILEKLQRAIHEHDTEKFFAFDSTKVSLTYRKCRLLQLVLL